MENIDVDKDILENIDINIEKWVIKIPIIQKKNGCKIRSFLPIFSLFGLEVWAPRLSYISYMLFLLILAQVVQLLVQHGADVDVCDERGGTTPLHDAVSFGSEEVVKALLEAGARAGRKIAAWCKTPLIVVAGCKHKIVQ